MVFSHVATFFVDKVLGNYIENIDAHQLKVSLWDGEHRAPFVRVTERMFVR